MLSHVLVSTFDRVEVSAETSDGAPRAHSLNPDLSSRREALQSAYDDPTASGHTIQQALFHLALAKLATQSLMPLTLEEHICDDAIILDAQVNNGGFAQWIYNRYFVRTIMTRMALRCIGASWATELLDEVVRALPGRIRSALATNDVETLEDYRLSYRRERLLDAIDDRYFEECRVRGENASVVGLTVAYARRNRVGLL